MKYNIKCFILLDEVALAAPDIELLAFISRRWTVVWGGNYVSAETQFQRAMRGTWLL
jgi:hypothetical protein